MLHPVAFSMLNLIAKRLFSVNRFICYDYEQHRKMALRVSNWKLLCIISIIAGVGIRPDFTLPKTNHFQKQDLHIWNQRKSAIRCGRVIVKIRINSLTY